ncbi:hypothetical protein [Bradyrhizobium jicamae]|uniref:hypothetical protein n=1 Tax=Bradyrhizobium jicamae TaxID=280332 RepID=UPI001BAC8FB6|nr:hypothetical protein [Bradyrhizobium jicamae]
MELTAGEISDIETKMEAGASMKDLDLSHAKALGFEAHRAENPEWSLGLRLFDRVGRRLLLTGQRRATADKLPGSP